MCTIVLNYLRATPGRIARHGMLIVLVHQLCGQAAHVLNCVVVHSFTRELSVVCVCVWYIHPAPYMVLLQLPQG